MTPNPFEPLIYRSADFINNISDFEHLTVEQSEMMIKTIVQEFCLQKGEKSTQYKNSRRYIIMMMFDLRGKPKRQL